MSKFSFSPSKNYMGRKTITVFMTPSDDELWSDAAMVIMLGMGRDLAEKIPHSEHTRDQEGAEKIVGNLSTPRVTVENGALCISIEILPRMIRAKEVTDAKLDEYYALLLQHGFSRRTELAVT